MTVRTRLLLTIAGISALLAVPAIYGASRLSTLAHIARDQRARHARSFLALGQLQTTLSELDRLERSYVITQAPDQRVAIEQALAEAKRETAELRERGYAEQVMGVTARLDSIEAATREIVALVAADSAEAASARLEVLKPVLAATDKDLEEIAGAIDEQSYANVSHAEDISTAARRTTLLALGVSLMAALLIGSWTTTEVIKPVRRLRAAMAKVADGDFIVPENLPYRRRDEVGDLARSFGSMTQHLAKLDQMKAEFMSIATHELKTPINVIAGYSELVEEGVYGPVTKRQGDALESIRDQTQVLGRLVNQLLDISRLEAGGLKLEKNSVIVHDLFYSLQRSFSILAGKKNIDFQVDLDPSMPREIHADPDRVRDQVLGNLLANALKFTPEGGRVSLRAWGDAQQLHIEVSDSGVGIPPDRLPFIFDKFYQVGRQARSAGAGLGLAIAREIVDAHGGTITAESSEGKGTTFRIVLPVAEVVEADTDIVEDAEMEALDSSEV